MDTREHAGTTSSAPVRFGHARRERPALRALAGGGPEGNQQLTATIGVILIVLLAVIGVTILRIGQLIWVHLFVGLLLIGPIAMKMGSTGYRFARYYTGDSTYRRKGPPEIGLRLIAPIVVLSTVVVFVSGVLLMFNGPSGSQLLLIHKVSFIVWGIFTALHVLGHLPGLPAALRATRDTRTGVERATRAGVERATRAGVERATRAGVEARRLAPAPGAAGRWLAIAGPIVAGLVLAVVLIPDFAPWTAHTAFLHHGDH